MEEERKSSRPMCQCCPYMQQNPCMMQGMNMNSNMMYQQPTTEQMDLSMDYPTRSVENDDAYRDRSSHYIYGGYSPYMYGYDPYWYGGYGHYGHGHYHR